MARLILDESGKRRAFKLNDGRLTLGSGEENALVLSSPDVADVHAELRVEEGVVTLVPRKGVVPPTLLGRPVKGPTRLAANAEFKIGGAVFRLTSDEAPPKAGDARAARTSAASRRRETVQHRRRTVKRGMPGWVVVLIVVVVCVGGYFFVTNWLEEGLNVEGGDPRARYSDAVLAYNEGSAKRAQEELARIDLTQVTPDLKAKVEEMQSKIDADIERAKLNEHNMKGTEWLDSNLKAYAKGFLSGDRAERPKARYFIKRCDEFTDKWPQHPELSWVRRYRERFAEIAEMDSPAEFADLEWEVKRRTAAKPRDYVLVFELIEDFLQDASGNTREAAQALFEEQVTGREAYFLDRMQQSKYEWENGQYGKAVEWLVQVIVQIGDEGMEEQAIDFFLKMQTKEGEPLSDRYLESYQKHRPEQFEVLMRQARLREAARSAGLL